MRRSAILSLPSQLVFACMIFKLNLSFQVDFSRTKVCVRKNRRPGLNVIKLFTAVIYYVRIKLECLSLAGLSNCKGAMWVVLHPNWVKIYSPRQNILTRESLLMGKCQAGNPRWRSLSTDDLFVLTCLDWQHFLPFYKTSYVNEEVNHWAFPFGKDSLA